MNLPEKYKERMKKLLKDEYEKYLSSLNENRYYGLRVNTLKISSDDFQKISDFNLSRIPWCKNAFYYTKDIQPAKHPHYFAGLYYIQEPSAMAPVSIFDINPGDKVLDLCAAPGGKSTHLGAKLNSKGVLVSNDISASRTKGLSKNIELFDIKNAVVTSESPQKLAKYFPNYFDKILVDAPCSGEGMFRKEPNIIKNWERCGVEYYAKIQSEILSFAVKMLKPGGKLLYSTCTFSPLENEGTIQTLLNNHPDFSILPIDKSDGFSDGKPEWIEGTEDLKKCARLWPHKIKGEGHFLALLEKKCNDKYNKVELEPCKKTDADLTSFYKFCKATLKISIEGNIQIFNDKIYLIPDDTPNLKGLRIMKQGWYLGTLKKNRFEPSQAFAMGLQMKDVKNIINFSSSDNNVIRYLKGETIQVDGNNGWNLVCVDGYPLGWGKKQNAKLKNKYLKGWRWM